MVGNNAKNLIKQLLSSCGTQGLLEAKDVGGTTRYIADYSAYPAVVEDDFTLVAADAGISVGSGSSSPSVYNYQLGNTITSGLTGTVVTSKDVDADGNASITFTITLSNTSGADITISEIGYKQEIAASDTQDGTTATDRVFLLDRSVFDSITIAANGSAVIEYKLKAVVTNNGGAEGSKTITANGTYNAQDDDLDGYSTVTVNVPSATLGTKSITQNGTYNASSDSLDGYSQVTVNVSGGGGGGSITKLREGAGDTYNLNVNETITFSSNGTVIIDGFTYADGGSITIDGGTELLEHWNGYYYYARTKQAVTAGQELTIYLHGSGRCYDNIIVYLVDGASGGGGNFDFTTTAVEGVLNKGYATATLIFDDLSFTTKAEEGI